MLPAFLLFGRRLLKKLEGAELPKIYLEAMKASYARAQELAGGAEEEGERGCGMGCGCGSQLWGLHISTHLWGVYTSVHINCCILCALHSAQGCPAKSSHSDHLGQAMRPPSTLSLP